MPEKVLLLKAAAVIIAFILLGKFIEERANWRTSSAIKKLMGQVLRDVRAGLTGPVLQE